MSSRLRTRLRRRFQSLPRNVRNTQLAKYLPNVFTPFLGESTGGLKWKTYLGLKKDYEAKAWNEVTKLVARAVAGKGIVPNPFLNFGDAPFEPGMVFFGLCRRLRDVLKLKRPSVISTELVWDFFPKWATADGYKPMTSQLIGQDPIFEFTHTSSFKPYFKRYGQKTEITVRAKGISVRELNNMEDLKDRVINVDYFDNTVFNGNTDFFIVDKVFYVDELELSVKVQGKEVANKTEVSLFPVGCTFRKVYLGSSDYELPCIKRISKESQSNMNVRWVKRETFSFFIRHGIQNDEKYGKSAGESIRVGSPLDAILARRRNMMAAANDGEIG